MCKKGKLILDIPDVVEIPTELYLLMLECVGDIDIDLDEEIVGDVDL